MARWWQGAVGYEIYPRSFADSNDDGIGDLEGIRQRLPYLEWLGVDAVWIGPFYDSPGLDHGYDVADYREVNPIHGDIVDFENLVTAAHGRGIRVIVDIVPNHSSWQHFWFREARKDPGNPYRDYYIWRDPAADGGPPNNWVSHFGGPAWTLDEASGQYWCHLFLPEQPDLNWANPAVLDEFDAILRFWCDRGVDGFRIDVAHALMKDPQFRDNPQHLLVADPTNPKEVFDSYEHLYDLDQDTTVEIFKRWNQVVAPYDAVLIGESHPRSIDRVARYVRNETLHTVFYLDPGRMDWDPGRLLDMLESVHTRTDQGISWIIDNHDESRSATRFGGGDVGRRRSLAVMTFMMALGGFPFLWEGQELGLVDGLIADADREDPIATRNEHGIGRDGTRTVMPWDTSHANGFAPSAEPWLPAPPRRPEETVEVQRLDDESWLNRHRRLLAARKAHPDLWSAPPEWLPSPGGAVRMLRRGSTLAVANLDEIAQRVELPAGSWHILFQSRPGGRRSVSSPLEVEPETSYLLATGI
jgi:alpha-glucosidase